MDLQRLDLFLVAILFVGQTFGHDYMMTCSRPVVTKTARLLKFDLGLPCDLSKESWCNLPGTNYPWHAVRSFVFENQGLMRRMYGEVRQLSVLRMEFNGNAIDENGREFDEIFKPVNPTNPPTSTTSSTSTSSTSSTSSASTSSGESHGNADSIFMDLDNFNRYYSNNDDGSAPTVPVTIVVRDSDTANYNNDDANNNNNSSSTSNKSDSDTSVHSTSTNQTSDSHPNKNNNNSEAVNPNSNLGSGNSREQLSSSNSESSADSLSRLALDEIGGQIMTTTEETAGTTEGIQTTMMADSPASGPIAMDEEMTTEAIQHVLFQDAEKTTTPTSSSRTTTDSSNGNTNGDADSDAPQQIHRSDIKGVNACPVKEEVVAPYWANNTRGEVLALLNLYPFEQYIHWEKCTFEHRQMYCREGCRCEQQYRLHRLLAFDPTNECRGIFSDWFKFPSCCVCKCYLTSSDLANERFSFNRSPRYEQSAKQIAPDPVEPVNGIDDSHFYYKTGNFNSRQPR